MKKPRSIDYAKTNREKKIGQIFQNWMSAGRESMRVGGVHWMKAAFGAPIFRAQANDWKLSEATIRALSAATRRLWHLALAIAHYSALGDLIHC